MVLQADSTVEGAAKLVFVKGAYGTPTAANLSFLTDCVLFSSWCPPCGDIGTTQNNQMYIFLVLFFTPASIYSF